MRWKLKCVLFSGDLKSRLEDIGRADAVKALISGCPFYRIVTLEEEEEEA